MTLEPLLSAPPIIQTHAFTAIAAFFLGVFQLAAPKGTLPHKATGSLWLVLMTIVAGTSIFIGRPTEPGDPFWTRFSPIHAITVLTLVSLVIGIRLLLSKGPQMKSHARPFIGLFIGGLMVAGALAFLPGRIMHAVAFGG